MNRLSHQGRRFQSLLDRQDLALVQLEIDDFPGFGFPPTTVDFALA